MIDTIDCTITVWLFGEDFVDLEVTIENPEGKDDEWNKALLSNIRSSILEDEELSNVMATFIQNKVLETYPDLNDVDNLNEEQISFIDKVSWEAYKSLVITSIK